jgi:DNA-binding NarL/FixJ family response regulator
MAKQPVEDQPVATASATRPTGLVLVSAMPGFLAQINDLLSGQPDLSVLINAETADAAVEAMQTLPHRLGVVVVVMLGLGGEHDSFWLIRSIRETHPTLPVLACGADVDEATISWALFTGADGFVALEVEPDRFVDALRRTARREQILEGLPTGWLEREDRRVPPIIVLPESAEETLSDTMVEHREDLTSVGPEAGAHETVGLEKDAAGAAAGSRPSNHPPSRLRRRLFARRHRGQDASLDDPGSLADPQDVT